MTPGAGSEKRWRPREKKGGVNRWRTPRDPESQSPNPFGEGCLDRQDSVALRPACGHDVRGNASNVFVFALPQ
jgi:hypothetical protein